MRKLRVFESVSVDGYFCDDMGKMDWAHTGRDDPEFAAWVSGNASSGGELMFGRKTYQMMEAYWPTPLAMQQMPEVARGMNSVKKYLISRTMRGSWNNTCLLEGDPVEAVRRLKQLDGPGIALLGSGSIAMLLGSAGLVDEYQFVIVPVALGAGRTTFANRCALRLIDSRVFPCGNVVVTYSTTPETD